MFSSNVFDNFYSYAEATYLLGYKIELFVTLERGGNFHFRVTVGHHSPVWNELSYHLVHKDDRSSRESGNV